MTDRTLSEFINSLDVCIYKWFKIAYKLGIDSGSDNCQCCIDYLTKDNKCHFCPIQLYGHFNASDYDRDACSNTPYYEYRAAQTYPEIALSHAIDMMDKLIEIRAYYINKLYPKV